MPKNEPGANPGGLEDFINELNQATNLRLRIQDDAAQEGRVKIKKNPETKESKPNPELQILQKPDGIDPNPANIAAQAQTDLENARANILAALQQLQLQSPNQTNSLLGQWGDPTEVLGSAQSISMMNGLDLDGLRAKLQNLGFDALLNRIENAKASGNAQELAALQEALTKNLLAILAAFNQQASDSSNLSLALKGQIDVKAMMDLPNLNQATPLEVAKDSDSVRILVLEPSLTQELKIKQLIDLDQKFTLAQGARALGEQNAEQASSLTELIAAQSAFDERSLQEFNLLDGSTAKLSKDFDLLPADDLSENFLSAAQTAQASVQIATPTQIALSMQEASMVRGPLHQEIMTAAKAGGGRIQLELTPPEQGTIRIDLRIDQSGRAHLIVEGANDAAKARLDQGGQQLKQEFAQMGLNLTLDLRQGEGRFAQNQQFGSQQSAFNQPSYSTDRSSQGIGLLSENSISSRWLGDASGGSSGINLYA
jgi:hypothetical protein